MNTNITNRTKRAVKLNGDKTYRIIKKDGYDAIECLVCRLPSFNSHDISRKYCGNCHQFHDVLACQVKDFKPSFWSVK